MKRQLSILISIVLSICLVGCDDLKLRDKRELYDYQMGYRDELPSAGLVSADASAGVDAYDETASEMSGDGLGENPEAMEEYTPEEGSQENTGEGFSENGEGYSDGSGDSNETSGDPNANASDGSQTEGSGNPDSNSGSLPEGSGGQGNPGSSDGNSGSQGGGQGSSAQGSDNNGGSNGSSGDSNGSSDGSNGSSDGSNSSSGGMDGSNGSSGESGGYYEGSDNSNGTYYEEVNDGNGGSQDNGGSGQQNSANGGEITQGSNESGNQNQQDNSSKLHVRDVWTVEGSWSFTINSVIPGIAVSDGDKNPAAVYMIEYTYWNEGLKGDDGSDHELIFSLGDHIIDNAGRAGYGLNVDNPYAPQPIYPGQTCSAQIWVGVDNPGPFDVVVGEYDSTGNYQEVVYHLEV